MYFNISLLTKVIFLWKYLNINYLIDMNVLIQMLWGKLKLNEIDMIDVNPLVLYSLPSFYIEVRTRDVKTT